MAAHLCSFRAIVRAAPVRLTPNASATIARAFCAKSTHYETSGTFTTAPRLAAGDDRIDQVGWYGVLGQLPQDRGRMTAVDQFLSRLRQHLGLIRPDDI